MSKQGKEKGNFQNKCISALLREAWQKSAMDTCAFKSVEPHVPSHDLSGWLNAVNDRQEKFSL